MKLWPRRSSGKMRALTAAGTTIDLSDEKQSRKAAEELNKRPLKWQREAWEHHDNLELVEAARRWQANAQGHVRLYPAVIDPDNPQAPPVPAAQAVEAGTVTPEDAAKAHAVMARLRSPDGDLPDMQAKMGGTLAMVGEGYFVGTSEQDEFRTPSNPEGERWRAFSVEEVFATPDGRRWGIRPFEGAWESHIEWLDPETTSLVEVRRPHPRWSRLPHSPMRAANIICEELELETQAFLGTIRSRIPAGIYPIPNDLDTGEETDEEGDERPGDDSDISPVLKKLIKHISKPIKDHRSASSVAPFFLEVPPELLDKLPKEIIKIGRDLDPEGLKRVESLIRRLSVALEEPAEEGMGTKGEANHWNIYDLRDESVQACVLPTTGIYVASLVTQMYRPRLDLWGVADPELWTMGADASAITADPDMSEGALKGYEASPPVVGAKAVARSLRFGEDDMPDEEELATILEWRKTTKAASPFESGGGGAPAEPPKPAPGAKKPAQGADESGVQASGAAPQGTPIGQEWARREARLLRDVLLEANSTLQRMLERGQARLRNAALRARLGPSEEQLSGLTEADAQRLSAEHHERGERIRGTARTVPPERLGVALTPEDAASLELTDEDLFAAGLGTLEQRFIALVNAARRAGVRDLNRLGGEPPEREWEEQAEEHARAASLLLAGGLTAAASALLFAPPGPETTTLGEHEQFLTVSPQLIRDALTEAGGGARDGARAGGVFSGRHFKGLLDTQPLFTQTGFLWETGAPDRPFEPHADLEGQELTGWDDDLLIADPSDFPFVPFFVPGDHPGCQCVATPTGEMLEPGYAAPEAAAEDTLDPDLVMESA